jgi:hypothetical protein
MPPRFDPKNAPSAGVPHIMAGGPILMLLVVLTTVLGVLFIGVGAWMVYQGSSGDTWVRLFGGEIRTESLGIVSIFCGTVLLVLTFRSAMRTLVDLGRL